MAFPGDDYFKENSLDNEHSAEFNFQYDDDIYIPDNSQKVRHAQGHEKQSQYCCEFSGAGILLM